jgi:hypothetical protein
MMTVARGVLADAQREMISREERFGFGDARGSAAVERVLDEAVHLIGGGKCSHGGLTM